MFFVCFYKSRQGVSGMKPGLGLKVASVDATLPRLGINDSKVLNWDGTMVEFICPSAGRIEDCVLFFITIHLIMYYYIFSLYKTKLLL